MDYRALEEKIFEQKYSILKKSYLKTKAINNDKFTTSKYVGTFV